MARPGLHSAAMCIQRVDAVNASAAANISGGIGGGVT
jgi:hypothetical protein